MPLDQIANIAEICAALLVIVSLIYVGLQIRQNTKAVRLSTAHNITEEFRDNYAAIAQQGDLAEIYLKGLVDVDSLNPTEQMRFYLHLHGLFRAFENAYYQKSEGALDPRVWKGINQQFVFLKDRPGFQTYWGDREKWYSDDFQSYYNDHILAQQAPAPFRLPGQTAASLSNNN